MMSFKYIRKLTAFGLGLVYFLTNCVFVQAAESNFWASRRDLRREPVRVADLPRTDYAELLKGLPSVRPVASSPVLSDEFKKILQSERLGQSDNLLEALSPMYGSLRSVSIPPKVKNPKIVIHIQDVHLNAEAQENIGKALQDLVDRDAVDLVALEGAFGEINLNGFRAFPHKDSVRAAADFLLRDKKISGPVHTELVSEKQIPPLVGVDDEAHYRANVDAYRQSTGRMAEDKSHWRSLDISLAALKKRTFSSELFAFDEEVLMYRSGAVNLGEHVQALTEGHSSTALSPEIEKFSQALALEKSLDFGQVERERAALVRELASHLDRKQLDGLMRLSASYRLGQIRYADFYAYLKNLCEQTGAALSQYPAMEKYIRYVLSADGIDAAKLLSEISALEKFRYGRLAKTPAEKSLVKESRRMELTGKLLDFALTPEEWVEYSSEKSSSADLSSYESFYREAQSRDEAMARNLCGAMEQRHARTAVLVTGGFHGEGMAARLKAEGAVVLTYVPKISKVDAGSSYLSVFSQEKTPLDKMFTGEKLFLSPENWTPKIQMEQTAGMMAKEFLRPAGIAPQDVLTKLFGSLSGVKAWAAKKAGEVIVFIHRTDETASVAVVIGADGKIEAMREETADALPWWHIDRKGAVALAWTAALFLIPIAVGFLLESLLPAHGTFPGFFTAMVFLGKEDLLPKAIMVYRPQVSTVIVGSKAIVPVGEINNEEKFVSPELLARDLYAALDLSDHRDASVDDIKRAYRSLARKYHPDVNIGDSYAEQKFKEINEAYAVLKDPAKRAYYDRRSRFGQHGRWAPETPAFPVWIPFLQLGAGLLPIHRKILEGVDALLSRISVFQSIMEAEELNGKPNRVRSHFTVAALEFIRKDLSESLKELNEVRAALVRGNFANLNRTQQEIMLGRVAELDGSIVRWHLFNARDFAAALKEYLLRRIAYINIPSLGFKSLKLQRDDLASRVETELQPYFWKGFDFDGKLDVFVAHANNIKHKLGDFLGELQRLETAEQDFGGTGLFTLLSTYVWSQNSGLSQSFYKSFAPIYQSLRGRTLTQTRWAQVAVAWLLELPQSIPAMFLDQTKAGSYVMRHAKDGETIDSPLMQERLRGVRMMRVVTFSSSVLIPFVVGIVFHFNTMPLREAASLAAILLVFAFVSANAFSHLFYNIRHSSAALTIGRSWIPSFSDDDPDAVRREFMDLMHEQSGIGSKSPSALMLVHEPDEGLVFPVSGFLRQFRQMLKNDYRLERGETFRLSADNVLRRWPHGMLYYLDRMHDMDPVLIEEGRAFVSARKGEKFQEWLEKLKARYPRNAITQGLSFYWEATVDQQAAYYLVIKKPSARANPDFGPHDAQREARNLLKGALSPYDAAPWTLRSLVARSFQENDDWRALMRKAMELNNKVVGDPAFESEAAASAAMNVFHVPDDLLELDQESRLVPKSDLAYFVDVLRGEDAGVGQSAAVSARFWDRAERLFGRNFDLKERIAKAWWVETIGYALPVVLIAAVPWLMAANGLIDSTFLGRLAFLAVLIIISSIWFGSDHIQRIHWVNGKPVIDEGVTTLRERFVMGLKGFGFLSPLLLLAIADPLRDGLLTVAPAALLGLLAVAIIHNLYNQWAKRDPSRMVAMAMGKSGSRVLFVYDSKSEAQARAFRGAKRRLQEKGVEVFELTRETAEADLRAIQTDRIHLLIMPEDDGLREYLSETLGGFLSAKRPFTLELWENGIQEDLIFDTASSLVGVSKASGGETHVGRAPRILFLYEESADKKTGSPMRTARAWLEKQGFDVVSMSREKDLMMLEKPEIFDEPFDLIVIVPDSVPIEWWDLVESAQQEGARQVDVSSETDDYRNVLAQLGVELNLLREAGALEDSPELSRFLLDFSPKDGLTGLLPPYQASALDADLSSVPGPGILLVVSQKENERGAMAQIAAMLRSAEGYEIAAVNSLAAAGNTLLSYPGKYGVVVMDSKQAGISTDGFAKWLVEQNPFVPNFGLVDIANAQPGTPSLDRLTLEIADAAFSAWSLRWTGLSPKAVDAARKPLIALPSNSSGRIHAVAWPLIPFFVTGWTGSSSIGVLAAIPFFLMWVISLDGIQDFLRRSYDRVRNDIRRAEAMVRILKGESADADAISVLLDQSGSDLNLAALDHNFVAVSSRPAQNGFVFRQSLKWKLRQAGIHLDYEQALSRLAAAVFRGPKSIGTEQSDSRIYSTVILGGSAQDVNAVLESAIGVMRSNDGSLRGELALFPASDVQVRAVELFLQKHEDYRAKIHVQPAAKNIVHQLSGGRYQLLLSAVDERLFLAEGAPWSAVQRDHAQWRLIAPQNYFDVMADNLRKESPLMTADIICFGVEIFRQLQELALLATQA